MILNDRDPFYSQMDNIRACIKQHGRFSMRVRNLYDILATVFKIYLKIYCLRKRAPPSPTHPMQRSSVAWCSFPRSFTPCASVAISVAFWKRGR